MCIGIYNFHPQILPLPYFCSILYPTLFFSLFSFIPCIVRYPRAKKRWQGDIPTHNIHTQEYPHPLPRQSKTKQTYIDSCWGGWLYPSSYIYTQRLREMNAPVIGFFFYRSYIRKGNWTLTVVPFIAWHALILPGTWIEPLLLLDEGSHSAAICWCLRYVHITERKK